MKYNLTSKVFKVVTDNTSNMCAAFEAGVCRPGFEEIDDDDEFLDIDADSESHTSDDEFSVQQLDEVLKDILVGPEGLACVAHTLQLCIKDGLKPAAALLSTIQKAAKLVNHMSFKTAFSRPVRSRFSRITTSLRSINCCNVPYCNTTITLKDVSCLSSTMSRNQPWQLKRLKPSLGRPL